MASVNFMKCKSAGEAKAMMRHSEKQERLKHNHSNPDIDKSLTDSNSSLYELSYDEMCQKYDERIQVLDATTNTNKRSDRVTMFSLEYAVPEGLPEWKEELFLADVEKIIAEQYGERNIIESERHMDEKHTYIDHGIEKTSRAHGHTFVVPEIDGKLNGKKFSSKSQMMKLNKSIEDMSVQKYQVHFMTGQDARHQTVEQLKNESKIEEQQIKIERNEEILHRQVENSEELKEKKRTLKKEISDLKVEQAKKESELNEIEEKLETRSMDYERQSELEKKVFLSPKEKRELLSAAERGKQTEDALEELQQEKKELTKRIEIITRERDERPTLDQWEEKCQEAQNYREKFEQAKEDLRHVMDEIKGYGLELKTAIKTKFEQITEKFHGPKF